MSHICFSGLDVQLLFFSLLALALYRETQMLLGYRVSIVTLHSMGASACYWRSEETTFCNGPKITLALFHYE
jgi:hypothetical protein